MLTLSFYQTHVRCLNHPMDFYLFFLMENYHFDFWITVFISSMIPTLPIEDFLPTHLSSLESFFFVQFSLQVYNFCCIFSSSLFKFFIFLQSYSTTSSFHTLVFLSVWSYYPNKSFTKFMVCCSSCTSS